MTDEVGYRADLLRFTCEYARKVNKRIVITTDAAVISGNPVVDFTQNQEESSFFNDFWEDFTEYRANKLANLEPNQFKTRSVYLKDVVICSNDSKRETKMPYLFIFSNKILGVSLEDA